MQKKMKVEEEAVILELVKKVRTLGRRDESHWFVDTTSFSLGVVDVVLSDREIKAARLECDFIMVVLVKFFHVMFDLDWTTAGRVARCVKFYNAEEFRVLECSLVRLADVSSHECHQFLIADQDRRHYCCL